MPSYRNDRIKRLREERGLAQYELALQARMSPSHLSAIERGGVHSVGVDILNRLADHLGTSVNYLVGTTDDPRPAKRPPVGQLAPDEEDLLKTYRALREQVFRSMALDSVKSLLKADALSYNMDQPISFAGDIKSIVVLFGSVQVTLENVTVYH